METRSEHRSVGGTIGFYTHRADSLGGLDARFSVFRPEAASPVPVLYALAGLTADETTFPTKSGALRFAARHGLALVSPDTSPRGAGIPGEDETWDFGTGAGFYLDATEEPWRRHYRMESWVSTELPSLVERHFPVRRDRRGLMGHSMGGHGALTLALRDPGRWHSVSALAPIAHPADTPWGRKAFSRYLGDDRDAWARHDATLLFRAGHTIPGTILVDQGLADDHLAGELRPDALEAAAHAAGQSLVLRRHAGYDHSYWFIQTVIEDHVAHHAEALGA